MSLPERSESSARVLSFATAKNYFGEKRYREEFDRLNAQAEADRRFITALNKLSECRQLSPGEVEVMDALDQALACVIEATSANDGALLIKDEPIGDLIFALVHGDTPKEKLLWQRVPAGRGVAQWAVLHRRAAIVNSVLNDERFYNGIDVANKFHTRSIVAAPLLNGDEAIGVIEVLNKKDGEFFSLSDQNHLTVMAHLASPLLIQLRDRQAE